MNVNVNVTRNRLTRHGCLLTLCLLLAQASYAGDAVIYLVRHAEKVDDSDDPELSAAGRERANALARVLKDAGIDAVFSTDFIRTRETARPTAESAGRDIQIYEDVEGLVEQLRSSSGRALVVGHSNTTPEIVRQLGGEPGPPIEDDEYGHFYIVVLSEASAETIRLSLPGHEP